MTEEALDRKDLDTLNTSLMFLLLLVFAILLSLAGLLRQKRSLCTLLEGGNARVCPSPYPFQRAAGAISIGALGFFFTLALEGWNEACREGTAEAERISRVNLWASLFALCAAILRLWALDAGQEAILPAVEEDLPA